MFSNFSAACIYIVISLQASRKFTTLFKPNTKSISLQSFHYYICLTDFFYMLVGVFFFFPLYPWNLLISQLSCWWWGFWGYSPWYKLWVVHLKFHLWPMWVFSVQYYIPIRVRSSGTQYFLGSFNGTTDQLFAALEWILLHLNMYNKKSMHIKLLYNT